jgi:hypothetical protein
LAAHTPAKLVHRRLSDDHGSILTTLGHCLSVLLVDRSRAARTARHSGNGKRVLGDDRKAS